MPSWAEWNITFPIPAIFRLESFVGFFAELSHSCCIEQSCGRTAFAWHADLSANGVSLCSQSKSAPKHFFPLPAWALYRLYIGFGVLVCGFFFVVFLSGFDLLEISPWGPALLTGPVHLKNLTVAQRVLQGPSLASVQSSAHMRLARTQTHDISHFQEEGG